MKKICIALALSFAALSAHAASGCAKPKTAFDNVYCAGNLYSQTDRELNQAYGNLRKQLNASQQQTLKQSQLAWIKERNDRCSKEDADGFMINLNCAVEKTQSRLDFLKARERECLSTGCVNAKLAE